MRFPLSLYVDMIGYLARNALRGRRRFPLVLMLEPTHRCNLSCEGCGRIREYRDTLQEEMSLAESLRSVDECPAPVVTVTGGEPLLYTDVAELVSEILARGRHIYFCTNGLLLEESLSRFRPNPRFTWNVHFDGPEEVHDLITGRKGTFQKALAGVRAARRAGFRVTTNTTVFHETDLAGLERLFTQLTAEGVNGILVAPGFSYEGVAGGVFLTRREIIEKFSVIREWGSRFPIISNPLYMDFLSGRTELRCTPWGSPTRNVRGWKSPCYLITDTHYPAFSDLMEKTDWDRFVEGRDPRCAQCMMHCGFEPTVVREMGLRDLPRMIRWNLHG